jgi:prepilin-type N-terminal cleavage/methylation domain-containing protein
MKSFCFNVIINLMRNLNQKGITISEILVAIAVIGVLAVLVLPGFAKIRRVQALKSATEDIVSVIGKAHSQTLSSLNSSEYGVHFSSDELVLFKGTSYSENNPDNENIEIISPASISSINLTGGAVSLHFDRLNGLPNVSGTITVGVPGSSSKIITISATGSASVN